MPGPELTSLSKCLASNSSYYTISYYIIFLCSIVQCILLYCFSLLLYDIASKMLLVSLRPPPPSPPYPAARAFFFGLGLSSSRKKLSSCRQKGSGANKTTSEKTYFLGQQRRAPIPRLRLNWDFNS